MKPPSTPKAPLAQVLRHAQDSWTQPLINFPLTFLFGVRGYYFRTMGKSDRNDRNIYDDAIFLVSPNVFAAFNANTDPSPFRSGVATLLPGWHLYRKGRHGISRGPGYPALRPATAGERLPVKRDGEKAIPSARPGVAINIHRGGYSTTSSLGCQTIYPTQYDAFINLVYLEMDRAKIKTINYGLIDGPIN